MEKLPDNKEGTRGFLHAVDEQVTFYNSSISNVTRIESTNAVVNLAAKIGVVGCLIRANVINAFATTGLVTIAARASLYNKTVDIARRRNVYNLTHTSAEVNEYTGNSTVVNKHEGTHDAQTSHAGNVYTASHFRLKSSHLNIFNDVRQYIEIPAYFDYAYFDSIKENDDFGHQENQEAEANYFLRPGLNPADRRETWYAFPTEGNLFALVGAQQATFITESREYRACRAMTDSLKINRANSPQRIIMNASIPIPGQVNKLQHIRQLAPQPEQIHSAADMGASVKFILTRGARQTFEFYPSWLRNYYFGDSTSCYFGEKKEIYIGKKCTTTYEQYSLVTNKSLQHFSFKAEPAVIQSEGGLEFNQIDVPNGDAAPVLHQQIAIKADPNGDKEIVVRSKKIEISNIINREALAVQDPNLVQEPNANPEFDSKISIQDNLLAIESDTNIKLESKKVLEVEAPSVEQKGTAMTAAFFDSISLNSNTIELNANRNLTFKGAQFIYV